MISNRYACKICCSFAGIKLVSALYRLEEKKSPGAHVFHGTAKQVISSERNNIRLGRAWSDSRHVFVSSGVM